MRFYMIPRYTFFHKIVDCYHSAALSCFVLSCEDIIFYKFLKIVVKKFDDFLNSCYDCITPCIYCQELCFSAVAYAVDLSKTKLFLNSCNDCITASIYCQTIFKYSSWIRTNVSLAIPTLQLSLCGPLRPKPLDDKTLRNSLTNF